MAEEREEKDTQEEVAAKKPLLKFIILGAVVLVLGAGGYFAWDSFIKEKIKEKQSIKASPKSKKDDMKVIYPLDSFIVNLMDKAGLGKRYLKAKIVLEIDAQEDIKIVDKYKPRLRDTILLLLSSQLVNEINTIEGKLELKQALLYRINQVIGDGIVQGIYFTEFVVQ